METPFNDILHKIDALLMNSSIHEEFSSEGQEDLHFYFTETRIFIWIYQSISTIKMEASQSAEANFELELYKSDGVFILYILFTNQLNRFGEEMKNKGYEIPLCGRIKFYRDKVAEHWNEYVTYQKPGSWSQGVGKIGLPIHLGSIEGGIEERKELRQRLVEAFRNKDIEIEIGLKDILSVSTNPDYANTIFGALGEIKELSRWGKSDNRRNKDIIDLIFDFGFPLPIQDIEEYCIELADFIEQRVGEVIN